MATGPMALYRARIAEGRLAADPAQRMAMEKLQLLAMRLDGYDPARPKRVGLGLFGWGRDRLEVRVVPGLYLCGGVGRGKSMLMDLFFAAAPVAKKRRVHFHAFMQEAHRGIAAARARGAEDPVRVVADGIAGAVTLLAFDEMEIVDITDAMLVGRLFERLFERGTVIVATSNRHPDTLYENGLNRHLFLPFIALIKDRLEVLELDGPLDHRRGRRSGELRYAVPLGPEARRAMDAAWARLAGSAGAGAPRTLTVNGRALVLRRVHGRAARASFAELCGAALGPADFLAIAAAIDALVLDDVPLLAHARPDEARRFVLLIDALYEAGVRLYLAAAAEPDALGPPEPAAFAFRRTASRLEEMRSAGWGRAAVAAPGQPA